jgi:calcium-dependent protein kinase
VCVWRAGNAHVGFTWAMLVTSGSFLLQLHVWEVAPCPRRALQVISKRKLSTPEDVGDVQREVAVMHHLKGHPNVVALKDVFEDNTHICMVMELCTGGELFDTILKRGEFTEYDAASIMRPILSVVEHCHNMGVMHRDIKPENFLLANKTPGAPIKLTDFGVSCFFKVGG